MRPDPRRRERGDRHPGAGGTRCLERDGLRRGRARERAFTRRDVEALQTVQRLCDGGIIDQDTLLILARAMGQGLARLAEAQVDVFRSLAEDMTVEQATETAGYAAADILPQLEQLLVHVWRRQFAAATGRAFAAATQDGHPVMAVGFVDQEQPELEREHPRAAAGALRSQHRPVGDPVRRPVVNTIGDAVMYVTDDPQAAVEVALGRVEAYAADEQLPDVRGGVALGPVLVRLGDVFGQPVNLASRLTDEARARTVLVDSSLATTLRGDSALDVRCMHRRSVRGCRSLTPHRLQRSVDPGPRVSRVAARRPAQQ